MITRVSKRALSTTPLHIILLGAPGVGKGTYGKRLSSDTELPIFSTGDYMRKLISRPDIDQHPDLL